MTTRKGLVAKKWGFRPKNDDEKRSRRQNKAIFSSKWRREQDSSPKNGGSGQKMTTRTGFVAKIASFSAQNGDEIKARRQNNAFFFSK
ncbi:hypothetical protein QPM05_02120 [Caldibacillus thermoamylovorans]|nr:hypothetical protein [Caldibacillus thermoamylovorans]